MTPDVEQIRQALAAATPAPWSQGMVGDRLLAEVDYSAAFGFIKVTYLTDDGNLGLNDAHLVANAPVWLASCVLEIEALRAEVARLKAER